jgi:hypothetical protein
MSSTLTTHVLTESRYAAWNTMLCESAQGSVYSMPEYLDALCEAAGGTFRIVAACRNDELVGGVALYEQPSARGRRVSPRLLLYYNGVVLRDTPTRYPSQRTSRTLETTAALAQALEGGGHDGITLKNRPSFVDARAFQAQGWTVRPGWSYVVPIHDLEAAWSRVEQNQRRLVSRCANEGVVLSDDDDFDSFFRMHEATTVRKGLPLYLPHAAFRRYFTRLHAGGLCKLYHARRPDGQSIAAQLVLLGGYPVSHTVSAATDPAFMASGATPFLRWKAFEALSALGYAGNDLTDAALGPVAHFKSQLGGDLALCLILDRQPPPAPLHRRMLRRLRDVVRR